MKKILLLLIIAMLFPMMVGAQNTGLESIKSNTSDGLFGNELDAALTVSETGNKPGFSELTNNYLFAGLTNLNYLEASQSFLVTTAANPLWAGCYFAGEMPWSLFVSVFAEDVANNGTDTTTYTSGGPEVVNNVSYQWNDTETTTTHTHNKLFGSIQKEAQFLISLGEINTGLYLMVLLDDNTTPTANTTTVLTQYRRTSAANTTPVTTVVDYTVTDVLSSVQTQNTISLGVPLFLRTGDLAHTANIKADLYLIDNSTENSTFVSDTTFTDPGVPNETWITTSQGGLVIGINADYTLTMAGLFGEHPNNELNISPKINVGIVSFTENSLNINQPVTYPGADAAKVLGNGRQEIEIIKTGGALVLTGGVDVSNSIYNDFAPGIRYGINPTASIDFQQNNPILADTETTITSVDGDSDQQFTTAADTVTTRTDTFTNTDFFGGNAITTSVITVGVSLPMALEFQPNDWPIKLLLGSTPNVEMATTITNTGISQFERNTVNADGAGTVATETTVMADTSFTETTFETDYTIGADHRIGMNMNLGESVDLDISLDLSSAITVLEFKNLIIQAIVKLPN